jgi:signal transduction histidine kinase
MLMLNLMKKSPSTSKIPPENQENLSYLDELSQEIFHNFQNANDLVKYYGTILSTISQGVLFIDNQGVVFTYNPPMEKLLNLDPKKVLFNPFASNFSDTLFGFSLKDALEKKKSYKRNFIHIGEQTVEVSATYIENSGKNEKRGLLICINDSHELNTLQKSKERNLRINELGEMVSMMAHEFRNPLGGIKGFASLLERDLKDRPDLAKMAAYIVKGTENLNDLVTRALNYCRPMDLQLKSCNLNQFILDLKKHILQEESLKKKITYSFHMPKEPLLATIDQFFFRTALLNLISNAVWATPEGGAITLTLKALQNDFELKLQDTGIGIPEENIKKIFSPFFTTRPEGMGIGLSEVHKIVQAHGGTVELESVVDQGATFTIKIPLQKRSKSKEVNYEC